MTRYLPWMYASLVSIGLMTATHGVAASDGVQLSATVSTPTMLTESKNTTYLRISLDGPEIQAAANRPPVNVAIVIDKSGSMGGKKIEQAKLAAIAAVERLRDKDIVSIVLYDSGVEVLVPSTKATDRQDIIRKIRTIQVGNSTALFAGVAHGAKEVRKFLERGNVNRVILLSDGQANVGPASPMELADLGRSLAKENISVSTLGVGQGYNEDLMMQLAAASSGNHVFVEDESSLVAIFNREFDTLMSVVASDLKIQIKLPEYVRPVRVLGTEAHIDGREITISLTQLYSGQNRYFIVELEVNGREVHSKQTIAEVQTRFMNTLTRQSDNCSSIVSARFTSSPAEVENEMNMETLAYATVLITTERNRLATALRDAGKVEEAKNLLKINADELLKCALTCEAKNVVVVVPLLNANVVENRLQEAEIGDSQNWGKSRKRMVEYQNFNAQQQTYGGDYRSDASSAAKP